MTVAWAVLIFHLSTSTFASSFSAILLTEFLRLIHLSVSPGTFDTIHFLFRKLAHCTEYAIFSLFLFHCFLNSNRTAWRARTAVFSVFVAGIYSLTDEFHQIFVPGRTASFIDCGIDITGAALGILVVYLYARFFQSGPPSNRHATVDVEASPVASKDTLAEPYEIIDRAL